MHVLSALTYYLSPRAAWPPALCDTAHQVLAARLMHFCAHHSESSWKRLRRPILLHPTWQLVPVYAAQNSRHLSSI
jgi:hypothetical protein